MKRIDGIKFSVLISVYEKEKPEYFTEALESVYSQTLFPSEVVICEDGQLTDRLDKIVNRYKLEYPEVTKVMKFSKNRGLGLTLRDGVLKCSNEIIFRMDSDDVSVKNRFEKQIRVMEERKADIVGSSIVEYDEDLKNVFGVRKVPEKDGDIKTFAQRRNPMNHMTVCFKRSRVLEAGNYSDMVGFEDYDLWVRMILNDDVFYNIQTPLVMVRGGDSMLKRRGGKQYYKRMIMFERKIRDLGFITRKKYYENIAIRALSSVAPLSLRDKIYRKLLRRKAQQ